MGFNTIRRELFLRSENLVLVRVVTWMLCRSHCLECFSDNTCCMQCVPEARYMLEWVWPGWKYCCFQTLLCLAHVLDVLHGERTQICWWSIAREFSWKMVNMFWPLGALGWGWVSSSPQWNQSTCTVSAEPSVGGEVNLHPNIRGSHEAALKAKRKWRDGWGFSPASSRSHLQSTPLLNRLWHPSSSRGSGISGFCHSAWCKFIFWKSTAIWILVLKGSDECSPGDDKPFCSWTYSLHMSLVFVTFPQQLWGLKTGQGGAEFLRLLHQSGYQSFNSPLNSVELWMKLRQQRWCVCHFAKEENSPLCSQKGMVLAEMNTV